MCLRHGGFSKIYGAVYGVPMVYGWQTIDRKPFQFSSVQFISVHYAPTCTGMNVQISSTEFKK